MRNDESKVAITFLERGVQRDAAGPKNLLRPRSIPAATAIFGIGHNCLLHHAGHNKLFGSTGWSKGSGMIFRFDGVEQAFRPAVSCF
jgi:hypothetical protein